MRKFLTSALGNGGFPQPEHIRAQDLGMTYYDQVVAGEWLTTQTYNGSVFIELIQLYAILSEVDHANIEYRPGIVEYRINPSYSLPIFAEKLAAGQQVHTRSKPRNPLAP